jgi:hypothetical protein
MRNRLDKSSVAQSLDVRTRLKGSLRIPGRGTYTLRLRRRKALEPVVGMGSFTGA